MTLYNLQLPQLPPQPSSPLDDRYFEQICYASNHLSEANLNRTRIFVEIQWLIHLTNLGALGASRLSAETQQKLHTIVSTYSLQDAEQIKKIEQQTKHDVKAVEYFLQDRLKQLGLSHLQDLLHFACTSEDINNLSYAINIRNALECAWLPESEQLIQNIKNIAQSNAKTAMLSLTHGQPATPTTLGKEFAVYAHRLTKIIHKLKALQPTGKWSGATGNFAAHVVAEPAINWLDVAQKFVEEFELQYNPFTTQIEPHDWQVELYSYLEHFNGILIGFCQDIWLYIMRKVFVLHSHANEVGSSTMPHKVNPINFENAESNLQISNALLHCLRSSLVTSRMQRDLTDSSMQRNINTAFGHSILAIKNINTGLAKLSVNHFVLDRELDENWEVLAEALQVVMRVCKIQGTCKDTDPYNTIKALTKGKTLDKTSFQEIIQKLNLPQQVKDTLASLSPARYTGISDRLTTLLDESLN